MREHRKVLVIEDEKNLRLLYQQELGKDGFDVVTAATAADGLAIFESERPDLVVMDIRLPGMDGLEAMSRLLNKHPRTPVVLNSAYSSYKDSFMSWPADAYVVKSSDTDELRTRVRELLDSRAET
jgi:two-component system response regulator (stage 0 sporulation protein F)